MDGSRKGGQLVPPLIHVTNLDSNNANPVMVRFYPFIPAGHLKKRMTHRKDGTEYPMFNYVRMNQLPSFTLSKGARHSPG